VVELEEELGADWCWLKTVERFATLSTHVRSAGGYMLWSHVTRNCGANMWIRHRGVTVILSPDIQYKGNLFITNRSSVYKTSSGVGYSPLFKCVTHTEAIRITSQQYTTFKRQHFITFSLQWKTTSFLDKLTVTQLVKKFPAFYENQRFITICTAVRKSKDLCSIS